MKKFVIFKWLLLFVPFTMIFSGCASEDTSSKNSEAYMKQNKNNTKKVSLDMYLSDMLSRISKNWNYVDKIWANTSYKKHNVVLFYLDPKGNVEKGFLLNVSQTRPIELKANEWKGVTVPTVNGYAKTNFKGNPSISLAIDKMTLEESDLRKENTSYDLASHELFHFYYQDNIVSDEENDRSTSYPIDYKPRLYRKMLFINLKKAFENKEESSSYLGKAKYWHDKWKNEYSEEAKKIHYTDIAEGSAKYFEILANVAGQLGNKNINNLDISYFVNQLNSLSDTIDNESYSIGAMSGLILSQKNINWTETFFAKNKTLAELLLENVESITDIADEQIENDLKKVASNINDKNKEKMDSVAKFLNDKSIPGIILSNSSEDSFEVSESLKYKSKTIYTGYTRSIQNTKQNFLKNVTAIEDGDNIIIPLLDKYSFENGKLSIKSQSINLDIDAKEKIDSFGRKIFVIG